MSNIPLTPTSRRTAAAAIVRRAALPAVSALLVAEILDGTAAAVLRAAGLDDDTARRVLDALWGIR